MRNENAWRHNAVLFRITWVERKERRKDSWHERIRKIRCYKCAGAIAPQYYIGFMFTHYYTIFIDFHAGCLGYGNPAAYTKAWSNFKK